MDRRSWLWRRKSSEKSPGETESSGSISSHSERFSDDQAYSNNHSQSPEVTSKAAPNDEELNDSVKTLSEKLSAALLNISAKEDLVKQHAKVAEEAVSGWEKAENEVLVLKQKLEASTQRNSVLEDRVGHLDGALKECVRQIRQAREEQEKKIHEAVSEKTREWESAKREFESRVLELQSQLKAYESQKNDISIYPDLLSKLEVVEKENSDLKLQLLSKNEDLELRTIERDLSAQAAETASKHHLESIKKVAQLEAECRRLKALARQALPANNDRSSVTASSVYVESFAESQSDSGLDLNECEPSRSNSWASALVAELDQFRSEKARGKPQMVPPVEIDLMDDFLEMERLAASGALLDQSDDRERGLKAELEAMINRTAELEEKLEKIELEKVELEMVITVCQDRLNKSMDQLNEADVKLSELQSQLSVANEGRREAEGELEVSEAKREKAESRLTVVEAETKTLLLKVSSLDEELRNERNLSGESIAKCQRLEDKILKMNCEAELREAARSSVELKIKQDKELAVAANKFAECQKTMASLGQQLKSLATLEDFLIDSDKPFEVSNEGSKFSKEDPESQKSDPSDDLFVSKRDITIPLERGREGDFVISEKSRNSFGKFFPRSKSKNRNENL